MCYEYIRVVMHHVSCFLSIVILGFHDLLEVHVIENEDSCSVHTEFRVRMSDSLHHKFVTATLCL